MDAVRKIYPFLKGELFLHFNEEELDTQIKAIIDEFARQEVIQANDNFLSIHRSKVRILQLWSAGMREILQRYYITVSILRRDPGIARGLLEKKANWWHNAFLYYTVLTRLNSSIKRYSRPSLLT